VTAASLAPQAPPDSPPPTTTPANVTPPATLAAAIDGALVAALAAVLGLEGELEQREGELGPGYCVGRLEPRGLCVNVPAWGVWQYWDVDAQTAQGASNEVAALVALDLFTRMGVDAGEVTSIQLNGPLPQVALSRGASVMVAQDGRIAMVFSSTTLMPSA
jgi:hypothetical protein